MNDARTNLIGQLHGFVIGTRIKKNHLISHLAAPNNERYDAQFNIPPNEDNTL